MTTQHTTTQPPPTMNGPAPDTPADDDPGTAEPGGRQPISRHHQYPAGRLILVNPGMPPVAMPDDTDLHMLVELVHPGGHILLRHDPNGPIVNVLIPTSDPRVKWFDTGVSLGQTAAAHRPHAHTPAAEQSIDIAGFVITTANIQHLTYHQHPGPTAHATATLPTRRPRHRSRRRPTHRT